MTRRFALWLFLALPLDLQAHDEADGGPRPVPEAQLHRPTPMPDRIVLSWTGDPATTQAVTWRTDVTVTRALAQLTLATDKPLESTRDVGASTEVLESDLGTAHYHTAEFAGLQPDTVYAYRVGDSVNWSEWFQFRTARAGPAPFTFLYFGDAQNNIRTHWSRVVREAFREAPRAAFTLHAGDLINQALRDAEWGEWCGAPAWVNAVVPVVPTPGNHEYVTRKGSPKELRLWDVKGLATLLVHAARTDTTNSEGKVLKTTLQVTGMEGQKGLAELDGEGAFLSLDVGFSAMTGYEPADLLGRKIAGHPLYDRIAVPAQRSLTPHWRPQFALPRNGPAGLSETVYSFDYQGARIVSLNSNERQEEQIAWLRETLARQPQRWNIVTFHHPIFSPARNRDNPQLRALWKPVLDEFRVDLVLTGHDHTYARSGDISGRIAVGVTNFPAGYQQAYDPAIGTVYVVSVSGPKMYAQSATEWAVRRAEDTQLFQVITVEADELRYQARTATGRLYDAFTLRKRQSSPNQLIESLPPENRRPPPKAEKE